MSFAKNKQLIYGRQPIIEALESGKNFDKILVSKGIEKSFFKSLAQICSANHVPIQEVPAEKIDALTHKATHQGVAGFLSLVHYYSLPDILSAVYDKGDAPLILMLDEITDVGNFGAIVRSAWGAGVHAVVVPTTHSAALNADALKASAGALLHLPICRTTNFGSSIQYLKNNGLQIVATTLQTNSYAHQVDFKSPTAIIMGSEDQGVQTHHLKKAEHWIKIPILNNFDSYNVSVATGMVLYEVMRQRLF